jgi:hypothetical protein
MVPSFCQKVSGVIRIVYLALLIAYANSIDMVQHCKWIAYGSDGLLVGGKGCTRRMRPKLHLPVFGHGFRVTGVMA